MRYRNAHIISGTPHLLVTRPRCSAITLVKTTIDNDGLPQVIGQVGYTLRRRRRNDRNLSDECGGRRLGSSGGGIGDGRSGSGGLSSNRNSKMLRGDLGLGLHLSDEPHRRSRRRRARRRRARLMNFDCGREAGCGRARSSSRNSRILR